MVVNARWKLTEEEDCVINVYAHVVEDKERLWDKLSVVVEHNAEVNLCLIEDFNAFLREGETVGVSSGGSSREMRYSKVLVLRKNLTDVKIQGRHFAWYKPNGKCKGMIDRALINEKWEGRWNCTSLRCLKQSVLDHCAIVFDTRKEEGGPKPFRFINARISRPRFMEVMEGRGGRGVWVGEGVLCLRRS